MHVNELSALQNHIRRPPLAPAQAVSLSGVCPALLKLVALHSRLLVHGPISAVRRCSDCLTQSCTAGAWAARSRCSVRGAQLNT